MLSQKQAPLRSTKLAARHTCTVITQYFHLLLPIIEASNFPDNFFRNLFVSFDGFDSNSFLFSGAGTYSVDHMKRQ
jgi:hypothetical protein